MAFGGLIVLFVWLALSAGPAAACTAADANLSSIDGLKLRLPQQGSTVLSAYLPPSSLAVSSRPSLHSDSESRQGTEPDHKVTLAQPSPASPNTDSLDGSHGIKPLAMLAAALVLMVSIALRRSGKR